MKNETQIQNPDQFMIVGIMKNEGPYLVEWLAHHISAGFGKYLIFTNDCDDLTDRMLDRLEVMGLVYHRPNPRVVFRHLGVWHVAALRYATHFNQYKDAKWVFAIDVDEFIEIKVGDHTVSDLMQHTEPFDLISFSVVGYNSAGVKHIENGSVQDRFLISQIDMENLGDTQAAVKTIMRNQIKGTMFRNHRPKINGFSSMGLTWVDGSGHKVTDAFTDNKTNGLSLNGRTELAQINHHSLRSMESFLIKADRGDAMSDTRMGMGPEQIENSIKYWENRNVRTTGRARSISPPKGYADVYANIMADPIIAEMHAESLEIHKKKIKTILQTEGGEKLARSIGYFD